MTEPTADRNPSPPRGRGDRSSQLKKSKIGGIAVIVLLGLYTLLQPTLNERFGLDLPALRPNSNGDVTIVDSNSSDIESTVIAPSGDSESTHRDSASTDSADAIAESRQSDEQGQDGLLYGLLKEVSPKRYVSPEGLQYGPGSAEGHRLEHLRRHTKDDPRRPGSHGVFDGDMAGALKTIDKAYQRAKKGQSTTKETDDDRTIYTVDMGGRIGYVGGSNGARKRNPMARRVRLVLEGTRVITAYPL